MAKAKRKGLSKKTRFEVFKRDHFTCQYCGKTPPAVVLEVDHIVPVASGGTNDQLNLISACFECNNGKGAGDLKAVPSPLAEQMAVERERAEQVKEFNALLLELRSDTNAAVIRLGRHWHNAFMEERDRWCFYHDSKEEKTLRTFLKRLPEVTIMEMMDVALSKGYIDPEEREDDRAFRYFCGCCWKQIKGATE